MKKLILLPVLVLCLLLALPMNALATEECLDEELNIAFTMPDGWTRYTEAESTDKKFVFRKDASENGTYFSYTIMDLYGAMSDSFKEQYSRDKIDNSTFTLEEYKALFEENLTAEKGVTELDISQATVADNDFFKLTFKQSQSDGTSENVILYTHIYDGYHTYYRYETFEDTADTAEAEAIIATVKFNNETKKNKTQTDAEKEIKDTGKDILSGVVGKIIWVVAAAVILALVRIIIAKKGAKKADKTFENSANQNNVFVATPAAPAEPEVPAEPAAPAEPEVPAEEPTEE